MIRINAQRVSLTIPSPIQPDEVWATINAMRRLGRGGHAILRTMRAMTAKLHALTAPSAAD